MRRLAALACLAVSVVLPASASASDQMPGAAYAGHYVGETSNILLGPARLQFELGEPDHYRNAVVSNFACGCGTAVPWSASMNWGEFEASSYDHAARAFALFFGTARSATRLAGWGRGGGSWGRLEWTWSAEWVPDLAGAEVDAAALARLGGEARVAVVGGGGAEPEDRKIAQVDGALTELSDRINGDARQTAVAEGLVRPAAYGAPGGASRASRTRISRWARDAERAGRRLGARAAALQPLLRRVASRQVRLGPGAGARIRAIAGALAVRAARLGGELH